MKRKLSPWCKEVKKTLIDRDMSVTELCGEVGMCRNYVTTTIMGIPEGTLPVGWWIGFQVTDADVWEKVKDGTYSMFSIEGEAERVEVNNE